MALLDDIASGGTARPLAAFLVGRENRRQRIRQENIDAQAQATAESQNELRAAQTERLRNPIQQPVDTFRVATAEEKRAAAIPENSFAQINTRTNEIEVKHAPRELVKNVINGSDAEAEANAAGLKKLSENAGVRFGDRNQEAVKSAQADQDLDRMELALKRGAQTGAGEQFILAGRQFLETVGVADLPPDAQEQEIFDSISGRLMLVVRNPDSGLGLPGNSSNKDLDLLERVVPNLSRDEQGNLSLIDYNKRVNQMKRDVSGEQVRLLNSGVPLLSIESKLLDYIADYDIFTPQERATIESDNEVRSKSIQERFEVETAEPDVSDDDVLNTILSR